MDPNANLKEQRELAKNIIEDGEELAGDDELVNAAERLAELVQALDEWITFKGFLPEEWQENRPCQVYKEECADHGFVHGQEAEELRKGIEELIGGLGDDDTVDVDLLIMDLTRLLNTVDARDSVAFLEAKK